MQDIFKNTILEHSKRITFSKDTHSYTVNGESLTPVTTFIKKFQEPFDTQRIATAYATKNKKNVDDVIKDWDKVRKESADLGTDVHDFGERLFYLYHKFNDKCLTIDSENTNIEHKVQMVQFWKDLDKQRYIPLLVETKVYSLKYKFSGTFDILFFDRVKQGLIIGDYKTNKDLYKNFMGKTLLHPFEYLLDTPYNLYQLQTSTYQIPLEDMGLPIVDRWVIHITPTSYQVLPCNNFVPNIKKYAN